MKIETNYQHNEKNIYFYRLSYAQHICSGTKQPTVDELEAQVKAGQAISLMDLADAVQEERRASKETTEKRPSMLARLREPAPRQERKPKSPKKHKEQER